MALTKKKKTLFIVVGIALALFGFISKRRIVGSWNGSSWDQIQKEYKGISIGMFSSVVTVSSRPDLSGVLKNGNRIEWSNGSVWTRS